MKTWNQRPGAPASIRRQGFTLVELLAVIAIILLLVGLILPGIAAVRNAARKAKARGDISALEHAIKAYVNDNGKLPFPNASFHGKSEPDYFASDADSEEVVAMLATVNNPRGIVYLDARDNTTPGAYKDPWGTQYAMKFDADYNGVLAYPNGTPESIPAPVIVISYGPNRKPDDPAGGDDIVSEAWRIRSAAGR